ncbi:MAG: CPBP family intramembrane metalloprotease [Firmicutes bacterium]|nr:CPBP family intramembrane metalloprotease [Bacillota bacterium]
MFGIIAFLAVITTSLVVPPFFSAVGLNPSNVNIYVLFALYIFLYSIYFLIFILFAKMKARTFINADGLIGNGNYKDLVKIYNFKRPRIFDSGLIILMGVASILAFMILQNGLLEVFRDWGFNSDDAGNLEMQNFGHFVMLVVVMAVIPSIVEELLFRGLILHSFMPFGKAVAILASSLLFSLFHLNPAQTVYQFFFGIVLALVYLRTKNMWYPMLLHFVNNFAIITYTYITRTMADDHIVFNWQIVLSMWVLAIVGTLVVISMVKLLKQSSGENQASGTKKFIGTRESAGFIASVGISLIIWFAVFFG